MSISKDGDPSIYEQLRDAGVPLGSWEFDLHVPVTPETQAIVDAYQYKSNVKKFTSNIDGKLWFGIPFAYVPFYEKYDRQAPRDPGPSIGEALAARAKAAE